MEHMPSVKKEHREEETMTHGGLQSMVLSMTSSGSASTSSASWSAPPALPLQRQWSFAPVSIAASPSPSYVSSSSSYSSSSSSSAPSHPVFALPISPWSHGEPTRIAIKQEDRKRAPPAFEPKSEPPEAKYKYSYLEWIASAHLPAWARAPDVDEFYAGYCVSKGCVGGKSMVRDGAGRRRPGRCEQCATDLKGHAMNNGQTFWYHGGNDEQPPSGYYTAKRPWNSPRVDPWYRTDIPKCFCSDMFGDNVGECLWYLRSHRDTTPVPIPSEPRMYVRGAGARGGGGGDGGTAAARGGADQRARVDAIVPPRAARA